MAKWLFKSEPNVWSWDMQVAKGAVGEEWHGVRNYLARNNMTELFEDNQRDLEKAVEDLSEQLEKPIEPKTIPELRQKVTDLTVYVQKRRGILLSDTAEGFQEDRWSWNVTF